MCTPFGTSVMDALTLPFPCIFVLYCVPGLNEEKASGGDDGDGGPSLDPHLVVSRTRGIYASASYVFHSQHYVRPRCLLRYCRL